MQEQQQSPVYIMMSKEDAFDITLIALMDLMVKKLKNREWDARGCNTRRYTWLQQVQDTLHKVSEGYIGCLPEEFSNKAGKFCDLINADMRALMITIKG